MVRITIPVLSKKLEGLNLSSELRDAMARIKRDIHERLMRGVDTQGKPFIPYSSKYAERKRKSGRSSSRVDLFYTGNMLRAINTEVQAKNAKLFIRAGRNESVYAQAHQEGGGSMPQRRWWGASNQTWKAVLKKLRRAISSKIASRPSGSVTITGGNN